MKGFPNNSNSFLAKHAIKNKLTSQFNKTTVENRFLFR